ncbi:SPOR domain-containing protein [Sandaracinobacteroides hominis]|uniref:SPOR domain-containing protein n=1 Tax=Sandaracinobacteroides hominis TaxID=2780086 RepID=UPI0018F467FB|nr:SPOR domain-containing protein [Sandaracinobacteroides hominis]
MIRSAALAAFLLLAVPAFASVESGVDKWRAGDWDGAIAEWVTPAARGDADALFNMGQAYRLGRGVPQNRGTAIDYYRRAADKGHVEAAANLGITLWQDGRKTEALVHLRQASDKGDLRASYVLGVATFGGDVAPKNPALGYAYVLRARDGGLALAGPQALRMATALTYDDRARGEAAARALADGQPVAVAMAGVAIAAAPETPKPTDSDNGADEDAAEDAPAARPAKATAAVTPKEMNAGKASVKPTEKSAEKATEKPAEKSASSKQTAKAKAEDPDGWKVQLGAYANERAARTAWATLVSQSADLLKGQKPVYSPKGNLVRLQVGPFDKRGDAGELCTKLAAAGRPCFVTKG